MKFAAVLLLILCGCAGPKIVATAGPPSEYERFKRDMGAMIAVNAGLINQQMARDVRAGKIRTKRELRQRFKDEMAKIRIGITIYADGKEDDAAVAAECDETARGFLQAGANK